MRVSEETLAVAVVVEDGCETIADAAPDAVAVRGRGRARHRVGACAPTPRGDRRQAARGFRPRLIGEESACWRRRNASSGRGRGCTAAALARARRGSGRHPASSTSACARVRRGRSRGGRANRTSEERARSSAGRRSRSRRACTSWKTRRRSIRPAALYLRGADFRYRCGRSCAIGVAKEIKTAGVPRRADARGRARARASAATRSSSRPSAGAGQPVRRTPTTRRTARGSPSVDEVWESAELLLKVKEPIAPSTRGCATGSCSSRTCTSPRTSRSRGRSSTAASRRSRTRPSRPTTAGCRCSRR